MHGIMTYCMFSAVFYYVLVDRTQNNDFGLVYLIKKYLINLVIDTLLLAAFKFETSLLIGYVKCILVTKLFCA